MSNVTNLQSFVVDNIKKYLDPTDKIYILSITAYWSARAPPTCAIKYGFRTKEELFSYVLSHCGLSRYSINFMETHGYVDVDYVGKRYALTKIEIK